MRTTAKVDYAVRAAVELARGYPTDGSRPAPVTRQAIADAQAIPAKFLEHILTDLKRSRLIGSVRGADGGYWLSRPPAEITVADVIRAVLVALQRTWIAVRANLRAVLEHVNLADLLSGHLPPAVDALAASDDAWAPR